MKIRLLNSQIAFEAAAGETVLAACTRAGVIITAPCGGFGRCGKCKVKLIKGNVAGDIPREKGTVRACMAVPLSDIIIDCSGGELLDGGTRLPDISSAASNFRTGVPVAAAVALDIGTTTLSARLIDLESFSVLDTISELNDQRVFGADTMSRVGAAKSGKTKELFSLINRQTEKILNCFMRRFSLKKIETLSVSGNTVMLHLFLDVDPSSMGEIPFTPVFLGEKKMKGKSLSLSAGEVIVLPSVSAFVGGDITAGLTVLDFANSASPSFFIDVGTNGEMALYHNGKILCCSTAAGPAFEGAEISCGLGGINGAINRVELKGDNILCGTIGNSEPRGICGSGLVDAVAVMLKKGIVDGTGYMTAGENFYLAPEVFISAKDIRQFQLAKSAILSGIKILCKAAGLKAADIKSVFITGGMGFFINRQSAVEAGILPREFLKAISVYGNLSLEGAAEYLTSKDFSKHAKEIIKRCSVIDLASDPSFAEEFAENLLFENQA